MDLFVFYVSVGVFIVALTIHHALEVANEWEAKNKRPMRNAVFYGSLFFVALGWPVFCYWVIQSYLKRVLSNG